MYVSVLRVCVCVVYVYVVTETYRVAAQKPVRMLQKEIHMIKQFRFVRCCITCRVGLYRDPLLLFGRVTRYSERSVLAK